MSGAFEWLNKFFSWLARWFPRFVLIPPTHRGVRFGPRGGCKKTGAGIVVYWPITHQLLQVPITTQSIQLSSQILPSNQKAFGIPCALICAAAIQFKIKDVVLATTSALHVHALVDNRSSAAISKHFDPDKDISDWIVLAQASLTKELELYGITLERLDLTHRTHGLALKQMADWNYSDHVDGSNPLSLERRI